MAIDTYTALQESIIRWAFRVGDEDFTAEVPNFVAAAEETINDKLRVEGSAAHYFLNDAVVARSGYTHGALSVVWTMKGPLDRVEASCSVRAASSLPQPGSPVISTRALVGATRSIVWRS